MEHTNTLRDWECRLCGHMNVEPEAVYSGRLPDGRIRELHYCASCGGPHWLERSADVSRDPTWQSLEKHGTQPT